MRVIAKHQEGFRFQKGVLNAFKRYNVYAADKIYHTPNSAYWCIQNQDSILM